LPSTAKAFAQAILLFVLYPPLFTTYTVEIVLLTARWR